VPPRTYTHILLVEDSPARCAWFRKRLGGCDVTCDAAEAIEWLGQNDYDLILLDHDLREAHYSSVSDDDDTGYAVAAWLAENPEAQRGARVIVHSLNFVGAGRMVEVMSEAGRECEHIPFYYLEEELGRGEG
jgi:CheY-like chemotaxis protein